MRDVIPTQRYQAELAAIEAEHGDLSAPIIAVEWALMNEAGIGTPTEQAGVFVISTSEVATSPVALVFYFSFDARRVYLESVRVTT